MKKKKSRIVSDDCTVALALRLIYQEYYGFNPEHKIAIFLISEYDLSKLSGLPELTDKFLTDLEDRLNYLGLYFIDAKRGWLLTQECDFGYLPTLPYNLVESMQPGFVDSFFAETVTATEVEANNKMLLSN